MLEDEICPVSIGARAIAQPPGTRTTSTGKAFVTFQMSNPTGMASSSGSRVSCTFLYTSHQTTKFGSFDWLLREGRRKEKLKMACRTYLVYGAILGNAELHLSNVAKGVLASIASDGWVEFATSNWVHRLCARKGFSDGYGKHDSWRILRLCETTC